MGGILTSCGGLASVPHLSGHSVGKSPQAEGASCLGPGSSGGSFTHRSGFWGVVPWRLCPAGRLTREPVHGLSVWFGFLPVWQLCLEGDIQRSSVPSDPGEAAWHFLTLLQKAHTSVLAHSISWWIHKPSQVRGHRASVSLEGVSKDWRPFPLPSCP